MSDETIGAAEAQDDETWELVGDVEKEKYDFRVWQEPLAFRLVAQAQLEEELETTILPYNAIKKRAASIRAQVLCFLEMQYALWTVDTRTREDAQIARDLSGFYTIDTQWSSRIDLRVQSVQSKHRMNKAAAEDIVVRTWGRPVRSIVDVLAFLRSESNTNLIACIEPPRHHTGLYTVRWGSQVCDSPRLTRFLLSLCAQSILRNISWSDLVFNNSVGSDTYHYPPLCL